MSKHRIPIIFPVEVYNMVKQSADEDFGSVNNWVVRACVRELKRLNPGIALFDGEIKSVKTTRVVEA